MKGLKLMPILSVIVFADLFAQTLPTTSPLASVMQRIGITDVTITYYRPSVNGREIWGTVVPFGYSGITISPNDFSQTPEPDAPWRAGANNATTIEFTHDIKIEGQPLKKGKYALFIAPFENGEADIVLSLPWDQAGSYVYNKENDVARIRVRMREAGFKEQMEYEFNSVSTSSAEASLVWGEKIIPFQIEVNTLAIVGQELMAGSYSPASMNQNWRFTAAVYLMTNKIHLERALEWAQWLTTLPGPTFAILTTYANLLILNSKEEEAKPVLDQAFDLPGTSAGLLRYYGNQVLGLGLPDVAIRTYQTILNSFPGNEWAAYNGLANALSMKGEYIKAIEALTLAIGFLPEKYELAVVESKIEKLRRKQDIN